MDLIEILLGKLAKLKVLLIFIQAANGILDNRILIWRPSHDEIRISSLGLL